MEINTNNVFFKPLLTNIERWTSLEVQKRGINACLYVEEKVKNKMLNLFNAIIGNEKRNNITIKYFVKSEIVQEEIKQVVSTTLINLTYADKKTDFAVSKKIPYNKEENTAIFINTISRKDFNASFTAEILKKKNVVYTPEIDSFSYNLPNCICGKIIQYSNNFSIQGFVVKITLDNLYSNAIVSSTELSLKFLNDEAFIPNVIVEQVNNELLISVDSQTLIFERKLSIKHIGISFQKFSADNPKQIKNTLSVALNFTDNTLNARKLTYEFPVYSFSSASHSLNHLKKKMHKNSIISALFKELINFEYKIKNHINNMDMEVPIIFSNKRPLEIQENNTPFSIETTTENSPIEPSLKKRRFQPVVTPINIFPNNLFMNNPF
jgi:hypothetical protein